MLILEEHKKYHFQNTSKICIKVIFHLIKTLAKNPLHRLLRVYMNSIRSTRVFVLSSLLIF